MSDDRRAKMVSIRDDFSIRSDEYDAEIVRSVPNYVQMLDSAVGSLPFDDDEPVCIFDLGTGTGSLAMRVLRRFPRCRLTCVDMTEGMLDKARHRLEGMGDVRYQVRDFYELELPDGLDAVVSSLALHHLITDEDKRSFYARVCRSLRAGGVFVNADAVVSCDEWLEAHYKRIWMDFMRASMGDEGARAVMERHRREDSLPCFSDQLRWLSEAGFSKVDVVWKDHMGAVVWARK
ncbi:MAG: hypothetical protein A4E29_00421 [Methanomassiliicoccales archaeon PtaB.Bin134]|nr:MAG: hypothetical protein A4E29_00421 [Methanomassiliicoccales archaeon PtaB.Bin134]